MEPYAVLDAIGSSTARARGEAMHAAALQMARHLRWEHGLSRRKTAKRLDVREAWVKQYVDDYDRGEG